MFELTKREVLGVRFAIYDIDIQECAINDHLKFNKHLFNINKNLLSGFFAIILKSSFRKWQNQNIMH